MGEWVDGWMGVCERQRALRDLVNGCGDTCRWFQLKHEDLEFKVILCYLTRRSLKKFGGWVTVPHGRMALPPSWPRDQDCDYGCVCYKVTLHSLWISRNSIYSSKDCLHCFPRAQCLSLQELLGAQPHWFARVFPESRTPSSEHWKVPGKLGHGGCLRSCCLLLSCTFYPAHLSKGVLLSRKRSQSKLRRFHSKTFQQPSSPCTLGSWECVQWLSG